MLSHSTSSKDLRYNQSILRKNYVDVCKDNLLSRVILFNILNIFLLYNVSDLYNVSHTTDTFIYFHRKNEREMLQTENLQEFLEKHKCIEHHQTVTAFC